MANEPGGLKISPPARVPPVGETQLVGTSPFSLLILPPRTLNEIS